MEYGCLILGIFHVVIIIRITNTHFEKPGLIRINCDVAIFNFALIETKRTRGGYNQSIFTTCMDADCKSQPPGQMKMQIKTGNTPLA